MTEIFKFFAPQEDKKMEEEELPRDFFNESFPSLSEKPIDFFPDDEK